MTRSHDVVVYGATGFTGRLVAEALLQQQSNNPGLRWALAGRSLDKLAAVRTEIGAPASLPLIAADANDPAAMQQLAGSTRVVITTVGPYQLHGQALVSACANAGTDYVDLCGEPLWMAQMIDQLQAPAQASGARIVFSCGFDSIPFDLGVVFFQQQAQQRFGAPVQQVHGRVRRMKGGLSGGTAASALATFASAATDKSQARLLANPFALTPGFQGPPQPDAESAAYDALARCWTGPFVMATINTKNVHRSNALRGHPWGRDFLYDERLMTGRGAIGALAAQALATATWMQGLVMGVAPGRRLLQRLVLPAPGQGPGARARRRGLFDLRFFGQSSDGQTLQVAVTGDRDPGYGATSRMISQAALCLLHDIDHDATPGGVWTAGSAMGLALQRRLEAHAGMRFEVVG